MKIILKSWILGLAVALGAAPRMASRAAPVAPPKSAPLMAGAPDLSGKMRRPLQEARQQGKVAAVLFFVTTDCPISNRSAPEINAICRDFSARKVAFAVVQVDRALKVGEAKSHAKQYGFSCPVLLDRKHDLVRLAGASVTPEAVVLSPGGQVLYRGRIDDTYASLGRPRIQATRHDLRLALDAVCSGKPVAMPRTAAIGCYIQG